MDSGIICIDMSGGWLEKVEIKSRRERRRGEGTKKESDRTQGIISENHTL